MRTKLVTVRDPSTGKLVGKRVPLTAQEEAKRTQEETANFLEQQKEKYRFDRQKAYDDELGSIWDQLDQIADDFDAWKQKRINIKQRFPKPTER